jgi:hypothetical protein
MDALLQTLRFFAKRPNDPNCVTQGSPWIRSAPWPPGVVAESQQNAPVSPAESLRASARFETGEEPSVEVKTADCTRHAFSSALRRNRKK